MTSLVDKKRNSQGATWAGLFSGPSRWAVAYVRSKQCSLKKPSVRHDRTGQSERRTRRGADRVGFHLEGMIGRQGLNDKSFIGFCVG